MASKPTPKAPAPNPTPTPDATAAPMSAGTLASPPASATPPDIGAVDVPNAVTALSGIAPVSAPTPIKPTFWQSFKQGMGDVARGPQYTTDANGNIVPAGRPTTESPHTGFGGVLGGVVMGALEGAMHGLEAQGPRRTEAEALSTGAAGEEKARELADLKARQEAEQNFLNSQQQIKNVDQHHLTIAQTTLDNQRAIAAELDAEKLEQEMPYLSAEWKQALQIGALNLQKDLENLGLSNGRAFNSYQQAMEEPAIAQKYATGQVVVVPTGQGHVMVYDRSSNPHMFNTEPFQIRAFNGLDANGSPRWVTVATKGVGTISQADMTHERQSEAGQVMAWAIARMRSIEASRRESNLTAGQQANLSQEQRREAVSIENMKQAKYAQLNNEWLFVPKGISYPINRTGGTKTAQTDLFFNRTNPNETITPEQHTQMKQDIENWYASARNQAGLPTTTFDYSKKAPQGALPNGNGQKLTDPAIWQKFLAAAGGDAVKAEQIAQQNGWK